MEGDRGPMYINFIMKTGTEDTSGTSYIPEYTGTFYVYINVGATESYTIIVEQDLDSIPEFPSWIILPILVISTLAMLGFRNKIRLKPSS